MTTEITFKQVCDFIKKDDIDFLDPVDNLIGATIICSPMILGPWALAFLPLISVKNELIRLGKSLLKSISKNIDTDYIARQQRLEMAYGLICFTAFFEALDQQMPKELRKQLAMAKHDKLILSQSAIDKLNCTTDKDKFGTTFKTVSINTNPSFQISFPHPTENLHQQIEHHSQMWKQMSSGFIEFIKKLSFWEKKNDRDKALILNYIEKLPGVAAVCFEAQYFELARKYEEFAIWSNLHEHKKSQILIGSLSEYVQNHYALAKSANHVIDIGFSKMHDVVLQIPELLKISQADEIVESLRLHYKARVEEPIAEEKDEPHGDKPSLHFPRVCDAFIPQSFRVFRQSNLITRLEDEATWKGLNRRDDLGSFLLNYLSSPFSTETPLIILGHPGSGKSLLTTVLSAQLMSKHYTAIKVPLREVDAEAGIVPQIEDRIRRITHISVDSWAKLSGAFKNNPPLVILDGYDELLQASGKVFSGYLKEVQTFQKNELEQGRPVRVIVTSRITLIDKATIPVGSTIIRLLEFDKRQRDQWISIWNTENTDYFRATLVEEFSLPEDDQNGAGKILSLAEQPLLLLMLALFDSQENQLRKSKTLDRTILYDSLLRRFVTRERAKVKSFYDLESGSQNKEIDSEMQRLAVAALGMYNRRKLHILSIELNDDIKFFNLERPLIVTAGRALSQADMLLGSFFFVHKSKAQLQGGAPEHHEEIAAFEFLHNTFGEFLTADFILRQALNEVLAFKALQENDNLQAQLIQRLNSADGLSRSWFASLVYTPLFTRPVVLEMMGEWAVHTLKKKGLSKKEFISALDTIVLNQLKRVLIKREMPSIMRKEVVQEGYRSPYGDIPLLGHISIYSINLILLRVILTNEAFIINETLIGTFEDGTRPWDRLTFIWRSWFSLDNLNGITSFLEAERNESEIVISAKKRFNISKSQNRLSTFLNVGISLGDNISTGLAGLIQFDPSKPNFLDLDDIEKRLKSERIDLDLPLALKRIAQAELSLKRENVKDFSTLILKAFELALANEKYQELETIASCLQRGVMQLTYRSKRGGKGFLLAFNLFRSSLHQRIVFEIVVRNPRTAGLLYNTAVEIADLEWLFDFKCDLIDILFGRRQPLDLIERHPEELIFLLRLVQGFGNDFPNLNLRRHHRYPEILNELLSSKTIIRISEYNPEITLTLLQLMKEISGRPFDKIVNKKILSELIKMIDSPQYITELIRYNPEIALACLHLIKDDTGLFIEQFNEKYINSKMLEVVLNPRYLVDLMTHKPKVALGWLQFVQELNFNSISHYYNPEFMEFIFDPFILTRTLKNEPNIFAVLLSIGIKMESGPAIKSIISCLTTHLNKSKDEPCYIELLPIAAINDLRWLIKNTNNKTLQPWMNKLLKQLS